MASADELKKGMFILVNDGIYRIRRKEVVVCGTHSHSKTKLFVQNILGGGERNFLFAHKDKVEVPDVEQRVGQVISKGEGKITVMDTKSYETLDVDAGQELLSKAEEGAEMFFFTYNGASVGLKMDKE